MFPDVHGQVRLVVSREGTVRTGFEPGSSANFSGVGLLGLDALGRFRNFGLHGGLSFDRLAQTDKFGVGFRRSRFHQRAGLVKVSKMAAQVRFAAVDFGANITAVKRKKQR